MLVVLTSPLLAAAAVAIKVEAVLDRRARGPVLFAETRISQGREIQLLKLRTLRADALASLGPGPTHIKTLEAGSTVLEQATRRPGGRAGRRRPCPAGAEPQTQRGAATTRADAAFVAVTSPLAVHLVVRALRERRSRGRCGP